MRRRETWHDKVKLLFLFSISTVSSLGSLQLFCTLNWRHSLNANQLYGAIDIKNTLCENWVTACSGFIDNDLRSVVFGGQSYDLQQSS